MINIVKITVTKTKIIWIVVRDSKVTSFPSELFDKAVEMKSLIV